MHGPWNAKVLTRIGSDSDFELKGSASLGKPDRASGDDIDQQTHRIKIPTDWSDWLGADFRGQVSFRRNFNRPTGLSEGQEVWLVVEQVDFAAEVFLNEICLGSHELGRPEFRVPIHDKLNQSNILEIRISVPVDADRGERTGLAGGIIGSVRIEICQ